LPGSEPSGGGRDEPGKLIRFPYSQWIPEDGIEPLSQEDGEQPSRDEGDGSADLGGGSPASASDPDGFWASGETQEFVHIDAATGALSRDPRRRRAVAWMSRLWDSSSGTYALPVLFQ
jgi:hypothetical protein